MSRRKGKYEPRRALSFEGSGSSEFDENMESYTLKDSSSDPENLVIKNEIQHMSVFPMQLFCEIRVKPSNLF